VARLPGSGSSLIRPFVLALVLFVSPASAGPPPTEHIVAFASTPAVEAFARSLDLTGPDLGRALYEHLLSLRKSERLATDRDNTPKKRPPKTATELVELLGHNKKVNRQAGCYELSALYIALARTLGIDAFGMQRIDAVGTGQIGHIMAGVRDPASQEITVYDLQNERVQSDKGAKILNDAALAAHHYNHLAVAAFLNGDLEQVHNNIDIALGLASTDPAFRNNYATVLAGAGEMHLAIAEAHHVVELAPDVPLYRYNLGRLLLATRATRDLAAAQRSFKAALALKRHYPLARRDLGWTLLLLGNEKQAEQELQRAARMAPDGGLYLGLFYMASKRAKEAEKVARQGLLRHPSSKSLQALLSLALGDGESVDDGEIQRLRKVLLSVQP